MNHLCVLSPQQHRALLCECCGVGTSHLLLLQRNSHGVQLLGKGIKENQMKMYFLFCVWIFHAEEGAVFSSHTLKGRLWNIWMHYLEYKHERWSWTSSIVYIWASTLLLTATMTFYFHLFTCISDLTKHRTWFCYPEKDVTVIVLMLFPVLITHLY